MDFIMTLDIAVKNLNFLNSAQQKVTLVKPVKNASLNMRLVTFDLLKSLRNTKMQNSIRKGLFFLVALICAITLNHTAAAAVDCNNLDRMVTINNVHINQRHIFCGEITRNRAVGFHAQPNGDTPTTIIFDAYSWKTENSKWFDRQNRWAQDGIYYLYDFEVTYGPHNAFKSRSTMFPDHCSKENVLNAIAHASDPNNHDLSGPGCRTSLGSEFRINVFWLYDATLGWFVNTAYPTY